MNWEKIQYIFQIPISWYKKIHDRVFNAYGTNFIKVKEGYYGGMEIGLDQDELDNYLNQLSVVKSVDGISPDISGNVELCAVSLTGDQTIYGTKTFASNVYLSSQPGLPEANSLALATIGHVNTFYARKSHDHGNLNNDGTITNIGSGITKDYYIAADSNGDLYKSDLSSILDGVVKSVNDIEPDENGNVTIDVGGGGVSAVNGILPDATGNVVLGAIVHSVEGVSPDQNGNVELTSMVKSVNNVFPVNGNVEISSTSMDEVTAYIDEQGFALTSDLADYALTSDLANYALTSDLDEYAHTVDGHPAIDGYVDFALAENKWVMTNSSGNLTTTNLVPISLSSGNNGYLFSNNGSLEFKQDEYVTLGTEQTLSATKRFDNCNVVAREGGRLLVTNSQSQGAGTSISESGVTIANNNPNIFLQNASGSIQGTMYLGAAQPGLVLHAYNDYIELFAPANKAVLAAHPTDTTSSSKAIATVGYCQSNFGKVKSVNNNYPDSSGNVTIATGTGTVKSVDHHSPDSDGNVQLNAICTINGHNGDSVGNFAGVVTSVNGETPNDGAVTISVVETVNSTSPDANGNVDVGTVTEVDGHSPDAQGAVSFGLTASKWVKTDSSGHLTTTNDTPVSIPSNKTGQTTNITLVTGVTWNGTQLVVARTQLNFTNGVLTGTTSQSNTTIATVAYT